VVTFIKTCGLEVRHPEFQLIDWYNRKINTTAPTNAARSPASFM
jgi:hypothetical protein